MSGPSGVIALVLAETAAGAAAAAWLTGLWGQVKRGFFILTGSVALGGALLATLAASAAVNTPTSDEARLAVWLAAATSIALGLSVAALILHWRQIGWALGLTAAAVSVAMLVTFARVSEASLATAVLQLLVGAAFMGAVTGGLLLGHWYLVDRRLPRDHIRRVTALLFGAVALESAVMVWAAIRGDVGPTTGFSLLLTVGGEAVWLALVLGMVGVTALLAFLIRATLREERPRAVQAATGLFYVAVITAFTAELAAKVRFLG